MDSDVKILKLFLDTRESFTIKKIADTLKINYRIAYEQVFVLEKEGLLRITRLGNANLCEFTYHFNNKVYEAEYVRRMELFKNKNFLVLKNRLAELNFTFVALLFGSYAKRTATKHSDIDILAIGGEEKEIKAALALLPDKLHITCVTYESFVKMAKSKEFSVVSEAIKNNITLIGTEEYYRLLSNAGYAQN
ncbi:nucleotidyltransferase domain-containing protein [Candidatus Woesearchaeota archaeon]|nr:nucleotidyltransferase domain-containing protein [Candidatus Woesearchaeota archaeon]